MEKTRPILYDVRYTDRFDEFFVGTDIGADPTEERNRYLVFYFNFSAVSKDVRQLWQRVRALCREHDDRSLVLQPSLADGNVPRRPHFKNVEIRLLK